MVVEVETMSSHLIYTRNIKKEEKVANTHIPNIPTDMIYNQ